MPQNPGYLADARVNAGRITPTMPAPSGGIGAGLAQLGRALEDRGDYEAALLEQRRHRQDHLELLTATTDAKRDLAELDRALADDPEWRTTPERYAAGAKTIREKYAAQVAERIGEGRPEDAQFYRARFDALIDDDVLGGQARVLAKSRKREQDAAIATLDELQAVTLQQIAVEGDPARREALLKQARGAIYTMHDTGQIDAVEAGKRDRGLREDLAEQQAQALITRNPARAYELLSDPTVFPDLAGERRERWARQALGVAEARQRQRIADEERADRRAEKELARRGDEAAKRLSDLDAAGGLTLEAVQAARADLNPPEYRLYLKRLDQKEAEIRTDPATYARINARLDAEDLAAEIVAAPDLSLDDKKTLLERNRNALKDDRPASPYRRGRELVRGTLDPGQLLSGPASAIARAGMSAALDDFDSWVEANPQAPRAAVMAEARDTVRRYQIVAFDEFALKIGLPRHYRGARGDMTPEKLDEAESALVADLDAGRLPRELVAREVERIEQWRAILARKLAPAPGTDNRKR